MKIRTQLYRFGSNSFIKTSKLIQAGIDRGPTAYPAPPEGIIMKSLCKLQDKIIRFKSSLDNKIPLNIRIDDWEIGEELVLRNVKFKGLVSLQRRKGEKKELEFGVFCKQFSDYHNSYAGYARFKINKNIILIDRLMLSKVNKGIGSTIFKWLSIQASKNNKYVQINNIVNNRMIHLTCKYFPEVKTRINTKWRIKTEEEIRRLGKVDYLDIKGSF